MAAKELTFSIVICVYNGGKRIGHTLHSLEKLDYPANKLEVIVVDDGSTDNSAEVVSRFSDARLISHERNRGHSAARNTGFEAAKGRYVAYIDDDCIADPQWLAELEKVLRKKNTLAAGGKIEAISLQYITQRYLARSGYGRPAPVALGETKGPWQRFKAYVADKFALALGQDVQDGPVCEVYGANAAFPRAKLQEVGGFPKDIRSSEDAAICQRLRAAYPHEQIAFTGAAKVSHGFSPTFGSYLRESFRRQIDNMLYYRMLGKMPPVFPFPVAIVLAAAATGFVSWWLALAMLLALPLAAYGWWTAAAFKRGQAEYLAYAYMQFLEESARNVGLAAAYLKNFGRPYPHVLLAGVILAAGLTAVQVFHLRWLQLPVALLLIVVPGYLLLQSLGLRRALAAPWKRVAFMTLLGIFWNMVVGLVATAALPLWGDNRPLDTQPLLAVYGIATAVLMFTAAARRRVALPKRKFKISFGASLLWIIVIALPFCAVIGANMLNRGESNVIAMLTLGIGAVLLVVGAWRSERLPASLLPGILFSVSLAVLLSYMMRSSFLFGWDIQQEYKVMQQTQASGSWDLGAVHTPYDAMLSLTILPTLLSNLSGIASLTVFKVIFPILFSFVPVLLYYLYRLWAKRWIAFVAAGVFISQFYFFQEFAALARQQIAFLFFAGLLYVLFQHKLRGMQRVALGILLAVGVVVSHYSTTYLAIAILGGAFVLIKLFYMLRRHQWLPTPAKAVPVWAVLSLAAAAVIWYGPATHSSQAFKHANDLVQGRIEAPDITTLGQKISDKLQGDDAPAGSANGNYLQQIGKDYRADRPYLSYYADASNDGLSMVGDRHIPDRAPLLRQASLLLDSLLRYAWWILGAIGVLWFARQAWKQYSYKNAEAAALALVALMAFAAIHLIPGVGAYYNIPRLNQQALMFVALPAIVVLAWLLQKYPPRLQRAGAVAVLVAAFLIASGLMAQLVGGKPHANLNNFGTDYQHFYIHQTEVAAARWLQRDRQKQQVIYADRYTNLRLVVPTDINGHVMQDITPETLARHAYVFAGQTNTIDGVSMAGYKEGVATFTFPLDFIQTHKDTLYTNGYTGVYK